MDPGINMPAYVSCPNISQICMISLHFSIRSLALCQYHKDFRFHGFIPKDNLAFQQVGSKIEPTNSGAHGCGIKIISKSSILGEAQKIPHNPHMCEQTATKKTENDSILEIRFLKNYRGG